MNTNISFADDLAGPLVVSSWISCFLLGVAATQVVRYFRTYKQDSFILKGGILAAFLNDVFCSFVICADIYRFTIESFGNPLGIANPGWQAAAFALSTGISVIICQSYLIWRFYRVSDLLLVTIFMAACALAGLAYSLYAVITVAQFQSLADASRFSSIAQVFLSLEAATDVIISLTLVAFLWSHYNGTDFNSTRSLLRRLMLVSIESGLATTACAILAVILLSVKRNTNLGIAVAYTIGRIYTLTLLFNLNMRRPSGEKERESEEPMNDTYRLDSCVRLKLPRVQTMRVFPTPYEAANEKEVGRQEISDKKSVSTSV